jgi:hypothetical protein
MRFLFLFVGCLLLPVHLAAGEAPALDRLAGALTGTFSSADQARGDKNFRDVTLHVALIWTDRADGPWLYAEQALTDAPDHPYRQRIYQLAARPDGALECHIFDLPDPIAATGAWKDPTRFAQLDPTALKPQAGCTLTFQAQIDGSFKGGTLGKDCVNTLPGVRYATTEATATPKEVILWERGYNANDVQIWGSLHGGYVFKRVE